MKRIVTWMLSTVTLVALMFGYHTSTSGVLSPASPPAVVGSASTTNNRAASSGTNRTVTGSVAQTQWGPVQVQLTISGVEVTDVEVMEYPNGNPRDEQINSYALPVLIQETLDGQSADIDVVSGATVTSTGYQQSLQSALDEAGL